MKPVSLRAGILCAAALASPAWSQNYAGAVAGLATLSADAQSQFGAASGTSSAYRPQNGAALNVFAGRDVKEYVSIQGNYIWNRNTVTLTSLQTAGSTAGYQETRGSSQHSGTVDVLVYFRNRRSRLRPYLSAGAGLVHLTSERDRVTSAFGGAVLPPDRFSATKAALRIAVGLDVVMTGRFVFRYTFSESNSGNPISQQLAPQGQRVLKNFQNLFGILYRL
jgi:hypothetical protein